jgi:uncharacterized cupredoxin-like copper-binding protein
MKTRTILKLMATGLLILAATVFLTACSSSADGDPGDTDAAADHVDDVDVDHDDMDMSDADADGHDADADANGQAYLEAAPKDSLFLVDMSNVSFTPSVLEVKTGEVIEIAIQNTEATLHDLTIDKVDADVHISYLGGTGQHEHEEAAKDADVHFALTEAGSGVVHLKINEPGEYVFYCSVTGHQAAGMEGKLIVTDA